MTPKSIYTRRNILYIGVKKRLKNIIKKEVKMIMDKNELLMDINNVILEFEAEYLDSTLLRFSELIRQKSVKTDLNILADLVIILNDYNLQLAKSLMSYIINVY